jgi:transcription elongation GreA/GreB family factor
MAASELVEHARSGDYAAFEASCMEALERGQLALASAAAAYREFEIAGKADQLADLTLMIFENADLTADLKAAITLASVALCAAPRNEALRRATVDLYRRAYGDYIGFDVVLEASGLAGARPPRMAVKMLDLCLTLERGHTLISRSDDRVVEVAAIDRENGLFTLQSAGRTTTRPAVEVAREYDRVAQDDFRVLRALRPEQLSEQIEKDPVAIVIGLIHAHGGMIDADLLKHELVPRHIESKAWSAWWTRARSALKRNPHVIIEGRSPVILSYSAQGQSLEAETWEAFESKAEAGDWVAVVERYLREKGKRNESPDEGLLHRFHDHFIQTIASEQRVRPADALACALAVQRLAEKGLPSTDETRSIAGKLLRGRAAPHELLFEVRDESLRELGFATLRAARPDDWTRFYVASLPHVPANVLDKLATALIEAGSAEPVQAFVETGLSDIADYPELVYWLWKGPKSAKALNLPDDVTLFRMILDALSTLGRSVSAEAEVVKQFRIRVRAALALRNYSRVRRCAEQVSEAAAIIVKRQLQRLEGVGPAAQSKMLDLLRDAHPVLWVVKRKHVDPWADPDTLWATGEGISRRVAERDEIVNVKMRENAKRIGEAASHGDLSENSEYKFALEERDLLRARLAKINEELSQTRKLEVHDVPDDHVGIGSRVTLRRADDGSERVMNIFGPFETDVDRGVYSYRAPLSQQLMGRRVGDAVRVTLDGQDVELEIVACVNALAT